MRGLRGTFDGLQMIGSPFNLSLVSSASAHQRKPVKSQVLRISVNETEFCVMIKVVCEALAVCGKVATKPLC
jgi:hypothetical protein